MTAFVSHRISHQSWPKPRQSVTGRLFSLLPGLSRRQDEPTMELEVSTDCTTLIFAYFSNVKLPFEPNWELLFGTESKFFTAFQRHSNPDEKIAIWSFQLSPEGRTKYRDSRKSAVFGVGGY
jgi:hypothetical protein